ncbi:MAG: hypothetical protein JWR34_6054 [Mycobacterium sp.]|nr:hypothetical protein [Mycobacterium sp.]
MAIFDRLSIGVVVAGAGLFGVALGLSANAAAAAWTTGGYECISSSAGTVGAPAAAPCAAPLADMSGVPLALPGPVPVVPLAPPPIVPPLGVPPIVPPLGVPPIVPPLGVPPIVPPLGAPIAAAAGPLAAGAPIVDMAGGFGGKGDPIDPPAPGAPADGQPLLPGPAVRGPS